VKRGRTDQVVLGPVPEGWRLVGFADPPARARVTTACGAGGHRRSARSAARASSLDVVGALTAHAPRSTP
jgi:hypothetical protein